MIGALFGFETSLPAGRLGAGQPGQMRVRHAGGWTSIKTEKGAVLLKKVERKARAKPFANIVRLFPVSQFLLKRASEAQGAQGAVCAQRRALPVRVRGAHLTSHVMGLASFPAG